MSNFVFRLQRVFEYRELEEGWAKDNFLSKHIARMEVETQLEELQNDRRLFLRAGADDLTARMELDLRIQKLDDHERALRILLHQVTQEEEEARDQWILKRQDKSVLEKLREKAQDAWRIRQDKLEQAALDEFTVQRRMA